MPRARFACAQDLHALRTLGFRGEALPSIASVSRFTLATRPREAVAGTRVRIDGGGAPEVRETGCAPGTTVEVADLFHNVPARRKFLKSKATESGHVTDVCLRAALAAPALRLTLHRDGRRVREYLPVADLDERARGVFVGERLSDVSGRRDGVSVRALLGPPEKARTGASALYLYVNGRAVRERALGRAVAFAYGSVLPPGRYPVGVVYVEVDPAEVDVNVHPQKTEVRFAQGRQVLDAITRVLAAGLGTSAWSGPAARGSGFWEQRLGGGAPPPGATSIGRPAEEAVVSAAAVAEGLGSETDPWGLSAALLGRPQSVPGVPLPSPALEAPPALVPDKGFFGSLRVLGQVRRMLLVCEGADGLHVIDQHAADERIRFDGLRRALSERAMGTQRLLFPERVEVAEAEAALVDESHETLSSLGLDCTLVGPTTVAVHAVPALVGRAPPERLLRDVLDELSHVGDRGFGDAMDMALATMACHGAIRAGDVLSPEECRALLTAMDRVGDFAGHCPHGRPVVYSVSFGELERRLGR